MERWGRGECSTGDGFGYGRATAGPEAAVYPDEIAWKAASVHPRSGGTGETGAGSLRP